MSEKSINNNKDPVIASEVRESVNNTSQGG